MAGASHESALRAKLLSLMSERNHLKSGASARRSSAPLLTTKPEQRLHHKRMHASKVGQQRRGKQLRLTGSEESPPYCSPPAPSERQAPPSFAADAASPLYPGSLQQTSACCDATRRERTESHAPAEPAANPALAQAGPTDRGNGPTVWIPAVPPPCKAAAHTSECAGIFFPRWPPPTGLVAAARAKVSCAAPCPHMKERGEVESSGSEGGEKCVKSSCSQPEPSKRHIKRGRVAMMMSNPKAEEGRELRLGLPRAKRRRPCRLDLLKAEKNKRMGKDELPAEEATANSDFDEMDDASMRPQGDERESVRDGGRRQEAAAELRARRLNAVRERAAERLLAKQQASTMGEQQTTNKRKRKGRREDHGGEARSENSIASTRREGARGQISKTQGDRTGRKTSNSDAAASKTDAKSSGLSSIGAGAIRIRSFEELMAEKRRVREAEAQSASSARAEAVASEREACDAASAVLLPVSSRQSTNEETRSTPRASSAALNSKADSGGPANAAASSVITKSTSCAPPASTSPYSANSTHTTTNTPPVSNSDASKETTTGATDVHLSTSDATPQSGPFSETSQTNIDEAMLDAELLDFDETEDLVRCTRLWSAEMLVVCTSITMICMFLQMPYTDIDFEKELLEMEAMIAKA